MGYIVTVYTHGLEVTDLCFTSTCIERKFRSCVAICESMLMVLSGSLRSESTQQ